MKKVEYIFHGVSAGEIKLVKDTVSHINSMNVNNRISKVVGYLNTKKETHVIDMTLQNGMKSHQEKEIEKSNLELAVLYAYLRASTKNPNEDLWQVRGRTLTSEEIFRSATQCGKRDFDYRLAELQVMSDPRVREGLLKKSDRGDMVDIVNLCYDYWKVSTNQTQQLIVGKVDRILRRYGLKSGHLIDNTIEILAGIGARDNIKEFYESNGLSLKHPCFTKAYQEERRLKELRVG